MSRLVTLPLDLYPRTLDGWRDTGLTARSARAAMWLAQLAYEDDPDKIRAIAAAWNLTLVDRSATGPLGPLLSEGIRWLALVGQGRRILAFSGTDPLVLADWRTDLGVALNADDLHSGFADGLTAARRTLDRVWAGGGDPVWIVGHSLGAALAVLQARAASRAGDLPAAVYGFGMPRVGGSRFAADYEAVLGPRTYRFVHGADIVARLPLPGMGYRHVGRRVACASGAAFDVGSVAVSPDDDPVLALDDGFRFGGLRRFLVRMSAGGRRDLLGLATRTLLPPPLADHLPDRYWAALP